MFASSNIRDSNVTAMAESVIAFNNNSAAMSPRKQYTNGIVRIFAGNSSVLCSRSGISYDRTGRVSWITVVA